MVQHSRQFIKQYKDHQRFKNVPIVIDFGSWMCRAGWANEDSPRLEFYNILAKTRDRKTGELQLAVGEDAIYEKNAKSPFEPGTNIPVNAEMLENSLDFIFSHLGFEPGLPINQPVIFTEPPCTPLACRSLVSELLFDTYGVSSVHYGIDALFSAHYNKIDMNPHALILSFGHHTTHVIPILNHQMVKDHTKRLNIGGFQFSDFMLRLLQVKYPAFPVTVLPSQAESYTHHYCYVATEYLTELAKYQELETINDNDRIIDFPYSPMETEKPEQDLEEIERRKELQRERLREQVRKTREDRLQTKKLDLERLKSLLGLKDDDPDEYMEHWRENGISSQEDLEEAMLTMNVEIKRIQNKLLGIEEEKDDKPKEKPEFPLVNIPDDQLTDEQKKEKRKQKLLKAGWEAREKIRLVKEAQKLKREQEEKDEEARRLADPELWINGIKEKRQMVLERIKERKRKAELMTNRKSQMAQSRQKIMASMLGEDHLTKSGRTKKRKNEDDDDGFGAEDKDWMVYHEIKDNEESDEEADQQRLENYENLLLQYDETFMKDEDVEIEKRKMIPHYRLKYGPSGYVDPEDHAAQHQLRLNIERIRVPESMFQPSMIGIDQAGLVEVLITVLSQFTKEVQEQMVKNIFICGGNGKFEGLKERLEFDIRMSRPVGDEIVIRKANDLVLDAWRGGCESGMNMKTEDQGRNGISGMIMTSITKKKWDQR